MGKLKYSNCKKKNLAKLSLNCDETHNYDCEKAQNSNCDKTEKLRF